MSNVTITKYFKAALEFEKQKKYKLALNKYRQILVKDQKYFLAWLNTGAIYSKINKSEKAIICYSQALKQKEDKKIYYNLGIEYFKLKKYSESSEAIKKCLKNNSHFISGYLLLTIAADQLGKFKLATDSIKNILNHDPRHKGAHKMMVALCIKNKKYNIAKEYLNKLSLLGEKQQIINQLKSQLDLEQNSISESINTFKIISKDDPELKEIMKIFQQEMPSENKKIIKKKKKQFSNKDNKNNKDWLDLSLLSLFDGNADEAIRYLEKIKN